MAGLALRSVEATSLKATGIGFGALRSVAISDHYSTDQADAEPLAC